MAAGSQSLSLPSKPYGGSLLIMNKSERHLAFLEILQNHHKVSVENLAERFHTSLMTIRRDLNELAEQYNITRTHGGAMLGNQPLVRMVSFDESRIEHREEKEKIASKAAGLIRNGQRIYIDSGSTTRIMLDYLNPETKAVLLCNHLGIAQHALNFDNLSVIMLGGEMIRLSNCSSGVITEEQIMKYSLDTAFIGAAAIGSDGNLYDGYSPEARFKSRLFSVARNIYLLVDSTKINTYDINEFGHISKLTGVITDGNIDRDGMNLMRRYNVNVIIAE